ncbi:Flavoredoxin [Acidisarcina polymorpha]|uniref:Flavoredoxin n=1 Tax=Acidisarcina polymorpha TaxID=2211140 RepID=A0A2Z5FWD4_9BACT|nr:Flavoredoxin [Acidisarcina polymorpha]
MVPGLIHGSIHGSILGLILGLTLISSCFFWAIRRGYSEQKEDRIVRIAELEIYPDQLSAYRAALEEEIDASIRIEPGVLTLNAVSIKDHPEQVWLFETYRDAASYQAHLQSAHFKKYKQQTQQMVKSLTLIETDPILLGSKFR